MSTPLRIDFSFRTPLIIPSHPIHLDALLAQRAVSMAEGAGMGLAEAIRTQDSLPLKKWTHGAHSGYCASCLYLLEPQSPKMVTMTRKPDIETFARARRNGHAIRAKHFPMGTGQHKLYKLAVPARQYHRASAWCLGERDGIDALLQGLDSVGKLARNGFGRILAYSIEEDGEAREKWRRRNLPHGAETDSRGEYIPVAGAVRPPYWKRPAFTGIVSPTDWY